MHEVFSSLLEGRDENRYKCKSNTRVVKRACFRSWSLSMAFFTMGQVCLIHHHFLRGPSSTRSSGHRRSLLWIHQLLKNCPGGSQIAMTMGNHGKRETMVSCNRPCRSHHLRKRQRFQLQHRLGAIESMFRKWEPDKAT